MLEEIGGTVVARAAGALPPLEEAQIVASRSARAPGRRALATHRRLAMVADGTRPQLLAILQREGRLLDFLQEDVDAYPDAQIGAAVRDIHRGCKKALAEHMPLEPVLRDEENAQVRVDAGFDASRIRLVGGIVQRRR